MTLSEALLQGLQTTVIGLVIVFSVLAILMVVLMLMKTIFYKEPQKKSENTVVQPVPQAKTVSAPVKKEMDEEELIAVLTAAVAASLNTSTYHLQIKSYRRIDQKSPAWNKAGLRETFENRI